MVVCEIRVKIRQGFSFQLDKKNLSNIMKQNTDNSYKAIYEKALKQSD